jgi:glycine/D-amino acid oxidase-like deaminating enzyme
MTDLTFPVPNPVPSFWTATAEQLDDYQSSSKLPETCDVLIIGSGYAGAATAYHILKDNPRKPSVVLLEARQICSGATGRNGGHLKPDTYFNVAKYIQLYGAQAAAEIVKFETSQVLAVKDLVERENIECDFHLTRGIDVYLDDAFAHRTAASFKQLAAQGVVDTRDVAFTGPDHAERVSQLLPIIAPHDFVDHSSGTHSQ